MANFLLTLDPGAVEFDGKLKELRPMSPGPGLDSGLFWSEVHVVLGRQATAEGPVPCRVAGLHHIPG